jgi:hypothetical protein
MLPSSSNRKAKAGKKSRKTTPLGVEQLEPRLMNAIDGLEQNLQLLLNTNAFGSTQMVSTNNLRSNAAPSFVGAPTLIGGTTVRGSKASFEVLGTDDGGETKLSYTWTVVSAPQGGEVKFRVNGTNRAKANEATFNRAGAYVVQVTLTDAAGLSTSRQIQFSVVQVATRLTITLPNDTPVSGPQNVLGTSSQFRLQATDQFGQPISTLPTPVWTRTNSGEGSISSTTSGSLATVSFNRLGQYALTASVGDAKANVTVNVLPSFTSIVLRDASGRLISSASAIPYTSAKQSFVAICLDQFGGVLQKQPAINWSTTNAPSGASPTLSTRGNELALTLNRVGNYTLTAQSGNLRSTLSISAAATLTRLELLTPEGRSVNSRSGFTTNTANQSLIIRGFDQYGQTLTALPNLTWSASRSQSGGTVTSTVTNGVANLRFTGAGDYQISVRGGNAEFSFVGKVVSTLSSLRVIDALGATLPNSLVTTDTTAKFRLSGLDQFGKQMDQPPEVVWSVVSAPSGANASVSGAKGLATATWDRAGSYSLRAVGGNATLNLSVQVNSRFASLTLTPDNVQLESQRTQQYTARGFDQFGQAFSSTTAMVWSASGGTITSSGLYTAGAVSGSFRITATSGTVAASVNVTVQAVDPSSSGLSDPALRSLVNSLNSDNAITRSELIQIMRSAGTDGSVSQTELTDLRRLVTTDSGFLMPAFVRELGRNVVNTNPANLRFKGATAGNLAAGSTSTLLNNLIDKWFLGADEPAINVSGATYQTASGVLFNGNPSRNDAKQGYVGDCYFIASVTSIADANQSAIRNMFLDNGDGTFTVRFYTNTGTADYVSVNRRLPAYGNGTLVYAGLGASVSSASTTLWVALAEKAYAQWNETGKSGRDNTNTYEGIEGGWMSNVNRQVLGYRSTDVYIPTSSKPQLISHLTSGNAVTIGTKSSASNGLVGSHAYIVTGYNASNDTFTLFNPWGTSHPGALTWAQVSANCDFYSVTASSGTSAISTANVRSGLSDTLIGNWTTVIHSGLPASERIDEPGVKFGLGLEEMIEPVDSFAAMVDRWETPSTSVSDAAKDDETAALESTLAAIEAMSVDLAMSMESLDTILRG